MLRVGIYMHLWQFSEKAVGLIKAVQWFIWLTICWFLYSFSGAVTFGYCVRLRLMLWFSLQWTPPNLSVPVLNLVDNIFQLKRRGWLRWAIFSSYYEVVRLFSFLLVIMHMLIPQVMMLFLILLKNIFFLYMI